MAKKTYIDGSAPLLDGYCSTVQGLLDWFEVDLGFTELLFIQQCLPLCLWQMSSRAHHATPESRCVVNMCKISTRDACCAGVDCLLERSMQYGAATTSRLLRIIRLFCKRAL